MKKFEFTQKYEEHEKGEVMEMDMGLYHKFIHPLLMRGVLKVIQKDKVIKEKVKEAVNKPSDEEVDFTTEFRKWKMGKLRSLGEPYGARDTSKEELIEEIIEKVPSDTIKKYLELI